MSRLFAFKQSISNLKSEFKDTFSNFNLYDRFWSDFGQLRMQTRMDFIAEISMLQLFQSKFTYAHHIYIYIYIDIYYIYYTLYINKKPVCVCVAQWQKQTKNAKFVYIYKVYIYI